MDKHVCMVNGSEFNANCFKVVYVDDDQEIPRKFFSARCKNLKYKTEYKVGEFATSKIGGLFTFSNLYDAYSFADIGPNETIFLASGMHKRMVGEWLLGMTHLNNEDETWVEKFWRMTISKRDANPHTSNSTPKGSLCWTQVALIAEIDVPIMRAIRLKFGTFPKNMSGFFEAIQKFAIKVPGLEIK